MTTPLDEHLSEIQYHGFELDQFPIEYSGHLLEPVKSDAYIGEDGRECFHLCLWCGKCDETSTISGRMPYREETDLSRFAAAKVAAFVRFKYTECV